MTVESARKKLLDALRRLEATGVVISTDVPLRADGYPRSGFNPADPGVAVYFSLRGKSMVMAGDSFDMVGANLRSVGLAIEAMLQLHRHGGGAMMERAFSGFAALPAPDSPWDILGISPTRDRDQILSAFRSKAKSAHPDLGGSDERMSNLSRARDAALQGAL